MPSCDSYFDRPKPLTGAAEIDPSEALAFYSRLAYAYLQAGQEARAERTFRQC